MCAKLGSPVQEILTSVGDLTSHHLTQPIAFFLGLVTVKSAILTESQFSQVIVCGSAYAGLKESVGWFIKLALEGTGLNLCKGPQHF